MSAAAVIFWFSIGVLGYVFLGYPLLLTVMGRFIHRRLGNAESGQQPHVSLIISAYNEEEVIAEKIKNSLALQYPRDKLHIMVVSDASTDRTDAMVAAYASEGVDLLRMPVRGGKTVGLNTAVLQAKGDIVVFSDANALYAPDAVQKLVRNFADPTIGCVTGDSQYVTPEHSYVGQSEDTYWDYERLLKLKESHLGSMVGADGAIFAIRKHLFCPLRAEDINDFVIPLQIVFQGYRCVFEREAVCYENGMVHYEEEFRRKVRVVNRSWNGLFRVKPLLNPLRYGWFSVQLISHKLLRWLTPLFLVSCLAASLFLAFEHRMYGFLVSGQLLFYAVGGLGLILQRLHIQSRWLSFSSYFCVVNVAAVIGALMYIRGQKINIWEPEREGRHHTGSGFCKAIRWVGLLGSCGVLLLATTGWPKLLFWVAGGIVLYTYAGYPALCLLLGRFLHKPWQKGNCLPTVTLLIIAHNEEEVIEAKIENSLALDYPPDKFSIVVGSDGSIDTTNDILNRYEHRGVQTYCFPDRAGKMAAINRIFPEITTEIVVMSDASVIYAPDAIKKLVRNFADDHVGAVSGKVTLGGDQPLLGMSETLYYRYEWFIQRHESQIGSLIGVDGAMYAMRRELFQSLSDQVVLDDFVISMNVAKHGKRVVYEPEARGYEATAASLEVETQRRIRLVTGAVQSLLRGEGLPGLDQPWLLLRYVSHKVFRWSTPVFLVLLLVSNLYLLGEPFYRVTLGGQLTLYTVALVGALQKSPAHLFAVCLYFCAANMASVVGLARGILQPPKAGWDRSERTSWDHVCQHDR